MPRTENATARLLKRIEELEARVAALEARAYVGPVGPQPLPQQPATCGCPPNYACNSIVCPRRVIVSFDGVPDGVGFPD